MLPTTDSQLAARLCGTRCLLPQADPRCSNTCGRTAGHNWTHLCACPLHLRDWGAPPVLSTRSPNFAQVATAMLKKGFDTNQARTLWHKGFKDQDQITTLTNNAIYRHLDEQPPVSSSAASSIVPLAFNVDIFRAAGSSQPPAASEAAGSKPRRLSGAVSTLRHKVPRCFDSSGYPLRDRGDLYTTTDKHVCGENDSTHTLAAQAPPGCRAAARPALRRGSSPHDFIDYGPQGGFPPASSRGHHENCYLYARANNASHGSRSVQIAR